MLDQRSASQGRDRHRAHIDPIGGCEIFGRHVYERVAEEDQRMIDMIDDFAAAIPVQLIGDLLGIPETERGPLRKWSLAILGGLEPVLSKAQFEAATRAVAEFGGRARFRGFLHYRVAVQ